MGLLKSEQEDLKMLINISTSIYNYLLQLIALEKESSISEEYKNIINDIRSLKELEKSILERLYNKNNKNDLLKALLVNDTIEDLTIAKDNASDKLIKRRIAIKIEEKSKKNTFQEYEGFLKQDFINSILTILNEYLNDSKYAHIYENLIQLKYNLSFLYEFVENDLLEHNFNINPELYLSSRFYAEFKRLTINFIKMANLRMCTKVIDVSFEETLKFNDYSLKDKNNYKNAIIYQIFLRASLMFANNDIVEDLKDIVNQQIFANTMMKRDSSAENLLLDAINLYQHDIELPRVINLGVEL